jgi:MFS family permease
VRASLILEDLNMIEKIDLATELPVVSGSMSAEAEPAVKPEEISSIVEKANPWPPIIRALYNRNFRIFWTGNFTSNVGTWMQNVAQGWLVLQLTNSSFWLGLVGFIGSIPFLLFTLFGGVIADRINRRRLLIATQTVMMILAFVLAALTYFKVITIGQLALLAFLNGAAMSINAPSYQAIVPELVPRVDLANAIALNAAQFNMSRVLGPTLGGYAMAWIGMAGNFFLNGLSFLAVLASLFRIRYPQPKAQRYHTSIFKSLKQGFVYVRSEKQMSALVGLIGALSFFFLPFLTFIPYFVRNDLHASERDLGLVMACSGIGAFLAAATIAWRGVLRHRGRTIVFAGLFVMTAAIVFAYSKIFALSAAMSFCEGYGMIITISTVNVAMQQLSSDEMRGRVMSIYSTAFLGLPPLGSLLAAELSRYMTAEQAISAMAATGMLIYIAFFFLSKPLRELD